MTKPPFMDADSVRAGVREVLHEASKSLLELAPFRPVAILKARVAEILAHVDRWGQLDEGQRNALLRRTVDVSIEIGIAAVEAQLADSVRRSIAIDRLCAAHDALGAAFGRKPWPGEG